MPDAGDRASRRCEELLPWQLRIAGAGRPRRVIKTFMFTDMVGSTALVEALGDEAWGRCCDGTTTRCGRCSPRTRARRSADTGDGFFVGFDSPEAALACAVAIQRRLAEHRQANGFAPQVRIGLHASEATQVAQNFRGKGVHEAARIAALAGAGEILASRVTADGRAVSDVGAEARGAEGARGADRDRHGRLALGRRRRFAEAQRVDLLAPRVLLRRPELLCDRDHQRAKGAVLIVAEPAPEEDVRQDLAWGGGRHHADRADDRRSDHGEFVSYLYQKRGAGIQADRTARRRRTDSANCRGSPPGRGGGTARSATPAVWTMSPVVWTIRSSNSLSGPGWTIQYARKPSPVNLSNHPPDAGSPGARMRRTCP